jgi:hypothetical protein
MIQSESIQDYELLAELPIDRKCGDFYNETFEEALLVLIKV